MTIYKKVKAVTKSGVDYYCSVYKTTKWVDSNEKVFYEMYASNSLDINEISIPDYITSLYCMNTSITSLDLSEVTNLEVLNCENCCIEELTIPDSLVQLNCKGNNIKELIFNFPEKIKKLTCDKTIKGLEQFMDREEKFMVQYINLY